MTSPGGFDVLQLRERQRLQSLRHREAVAGAAVGCGGHDARREGVDAVCLAQVRKIGAPRLVLGVVDQVIDQEGLRQISDTGAIELIIDEVLLANTKSVEEYRSGKEKAFNALVGQIMKASKGKANPAQVNALLKQKLTPT